MLLGTRKGLQGQRASRLRSKKKRRPGEDNLKAEIRVERGESLPGRRNRSAKSPK